MNTSENKVADGSPISGSAASGENARKTSDANDLGASAGNAGFEKDPQKHAKTCQNSAAGSADAGDDQELFGDERLLVEIAHGATVRVAAQRAGMSERSARRRWADQEFRQMVFLMRREIRSAAAGRLTTIMDLAVLKLESAMDSDKPAHQIAAARTVIRLADQIGGRLEEGEVLSHTLEDLKSQIDFDAMRDHLARSKK